MGKTVVVVGAGISGIRTADLLLQRGSATKVVVLEARDRVGGRLYRVNHVNDQQQVVALDLGGQWIGPPQKYITEIVQELNIPVIEQHNSGDGVLRLSGQKHTFSGNIGDISVFGKEGLLAKTWDELDAMARSVPIDEPYKNPRAAEWDNMSVAEWLEKNVKSDADPAAAEQVRKLVAWFAIVCLSSEVEHASFLYFLWWLNTGGGYQPLVNIKDGAQNFWFPGSAQDIVVKLADRVVARGGQVVLNAQVTRIAYEGGRRARVTYRDSVSGAHQEVDCHHVVISVPPALIGNISFAPELPAQRAVMLQRMPMGCVIKFIFVYKTCWWKEMGLSGSIISDEGPIGVCYDKSIPEENFYSIVGFFSGNGARHWSERPEAERVEAAVAQFVREFGTERARTELVKVHQHDWMTEEFSRGCFMCIPAPGALQGGMRNFRAPHQNLHFVGTETGNVWVGYIDGAVESSVRAVEEIERSQAAKL